MKELDLIDISNRGMSKEEREKLQKKQLAAQKKMAAREKRRNLVIRSKNAAQTRSAKLGKKIRRGGIASLTGLSILLAGLFHSPADLMQQQTIDNLDPDHTVEIMLEEDTPGNEEDQKRKMESEPVRKGLFSRILDSIRSFLVGLPPAVKACICIPLWAIGYAIVQLVSLLFPVTLAPLLRHVLSWLILAVILLAVFAVTMKCLFPHLPLKKILSKRNILIVLAASIVLKILDVVLPLFWTGYTRVKYPVMLVCGIALLLLILYRIRKRQAAHKIVKKVTL